MPRALGYALFFVVALTLAGAMHYYVWARLVRDVGLPPMWHRALTLLVIMLFVAEPLSIWLAMSQPPERAKPLALFAFGWMGVSFLLLVVLGASDVVKWAGLAAHRLVLDGPPLDAERRLTLARLFGGTAALFAGGASLLAVRSGLGELVLREVRVALPRLPGSLHGTTIVQLTDLHVGPTIGRELVADVVRRTNALSPDVIVITGDLVDGSVHALRDHVAPLADLRARWGVYFVTGNHEYYSGVESWCTELERLGIRVLKNERVSIGDEGGSYDLAGINDFQARSYGREGPDLSRALEGRDATRELVLLAHQPKAAHEADRHGVGLQLSGHTHGGQIFPWNFLVRLQQPVVSGLARIGQTLVYVSNGTGYWGPPMRLGAPAEITKVVLLAESATA